AVLFRLAEADDIALSAVGEDAIAPLVVGAHLLGASHWQVERVARPQVIAAVNLRARAGRLIPSSYGCGPHGASVISFTSWLITSGRNFEANPPTKSLFANTAAQCARRSPSSLNFQMCTS